MVEDKQLQYKQKGSELHRTVVHMLHLWQRRGVFNHVEQTLIITAYQSTAVEANH